MRRITGGRLEPGSGDGAIPIHDWTRVIPETFHHFHHEWISTICFTLNDGAFPADYYAMAEQIAGGLHPDVLTRGRTRPDSPGPGSNGASPTGPSEGGIALATAPPRVRFTATAEVEQYARQAKAVVVRHRSADSVVAVVEIVSPGNRASRHELRAFVAKAVE